MNIHTLKKNLIFIVIVVMALQFYLGNKRRNKEKLNHNKFMASMIPISAKTLEKYNPIFDEMGKCLEKDPSNYEGCVCSKHDHNVFMGYEFSYDKLVKTNNPGYKHLLSEERSRSSRIYLMKCYPKGNLEFRFEDWAKRMQD